MKYYRTNMEWEAEQRAKPLTFESVVDSLGLEDFPEREYFMQIARALRGAEAELRTANTTLIRNWDRKYTAAEDLDNGETWEVLANHIDSLLNPTAEMLRGPDENT